MVDMPRTTDFPPDMRRAARGESAGTLEAMAGDVVDAVRHYIHEQPEKAMLWALGIGFVLGWRLKPW